MNNWDRLAGGKPQDPIVSGSLHMDYTYAPATPGFLCGFVDSVEDLLRLEQALYLLSHPLSSHAPAFYKWGLKQKHKLLVVLQSRKKIKEVVYFPALVIFQLL